MNSWLSWEDKKEICTSQENSHRTLNEAPSVSTSVDPHGVIVSYAPHHAAVIALYQSKMTSNLTPKPARKVTVFYIYPIPRPSGTYSYPSQLCHILRKWQLYFLVCLTSAHSVSEGSCQLKAFPLNNYCKVAGGNLSVSSGDGQALNYIASLLFCSLRFVFFCELVRTVWLLSVLLSSHPLPLL